jgi:hypothetical protein
MADLAALLYVHAFLFSLCLSLSLCIWGAQAYAATDIVLLSRAATNASYARFAYVAHGGHRHKETLRHARARKIDR